MRSTQVQIAIAAGAAAVAITGSVAAYAGPHSPAPHRSIRTPLAAAAHSSKTIKASETEFAIALNHHSGKAGKYKVVAINKGSIKHGLVVDGPGQHDTLIGYVKPHHKIHMMLKLKKGKYDIYCPVHGHKMAGMNTHFTVK